MTIPDGNRRVAIIGLCLTLVCVIGLWLLLKDSKVDEKSAQNDADQSSQNADAAADALQAQCDAGVQSACDQLAQLENQPDPNDPEAQDNEIQEPEVQEPEVQDPDPNDADPDDPEAQDPERQDPEHQDPDSNDPETNDPDANDPEEQDSENQDPEIDDPDPDDPENQDPEVDDPDPNSLLTFQALDYCDPVPGEYVTDVSISVVQSASQVVYTISCTTAALPPVLAALLR